MLAVKEAPSSCDFIASSPHLSLSPPELCLASQGLCGNQNDVQTRPLCLKQSDAHVIDSAGHYGLLSSLPNESSTVLLSIQPTKPDAALQLDDFNFLSQHAHLLSEYSLLFFWTGSNLFYSSVFIKTSMDRRGQTGVLYSSSCWEAPTNLSQLAGSLCYCTCSMGRLKSQ